MPFQGGKEGSIPFSSTKLMSSSSTYGFRIPGFHPGELGSIPNEDAKLKNANSKFKILTVIETRISEILGLG